MGFRFTTVKITVENILFKKMLRLLPYYWGGKYLGSKVFNMNVVKNQVKPVADFSVQEVLNQMPSVFSLVSLDAEVLMCNRHYAELIGAKSEFDLIGMPTRFKAMAVEPEALLSFAEMNRRAMQGEHISSFEMHRYCGDYFRAFVSNKRPFFNSDGVIIGVIFCANEILSPTLNEIKALVNREGMIVSDLVHTNIQSYLDEEAEKYVYLTRRESECLFYLARGYSSREIGEMLDLSSRTIESYLNNVKAKLSCTRRSELCSFAIDSGLVHMDISRSKNGCYL